MNVLSPSSSQIEVDTHPLLAELAATAELVRTTHAQGSIVWRVWGSGPPIVLLHGAAGTWRHWAKNIQSLAQDHTVFAVDMPGYGDSHSSGARTLAEYAGDIGAGLEQLSLQDVVLCAFSFGCVIASGLPSKFWRRIDHFVMIGAPGLGKTHRIGDQLLSWRAAPEQERETIHRSNLRTLMLRDVRLIDDLAVQIQTTNTRLSRTQHQTYITEGGLESNLERFSPPFSAMWGEQDSLVEGLLPPRIALLNRIQPGCTIDIVPDAGHWLPFENPASISSHIRKLQ